MARCCVLSPSNLSRPMIGNCIRTGMFVRALVARFDHVDLIGIAKDESKTWSEDFPGATYRKLSHRSLDAVLKDHREFDPFYIRFTAGEVEFWRQYLADQRPDVIIVEGIWYRQLLEAGRDVHDAPLVVNMHNVESELFRRFFKLRLRQPLSLINPRTVREQRHGLASINENEDFHFREARMILLCSQREATLLEKRTLGKDVHVVPNTYYRDGPREKTWVATNAANRSVVFVGSFTYGPNRGAAKQIIRKIAPVLLKKSPDLRVHVAGRTTDDFFARLSANSPNVTVSENLPDTDTLYEDALCLIVPLRVGAGTRLKILEAMYRGVPVVSTRLGAEGLGLTNEQDILFAYSTREFVAAIQRLHQDREFAAKIGANGRAFYLEHYSADKITAKIDTLIGRAAADAPSKGRYASGQVPDGLTPADGRQAGWG